MRKYNKILSICTLIIILCIVLFSYKQFFDYKDSITSYNEIYQGMNMELNKYIESLIVENEKKVEHGMNIYANNIHKEILKAYGEELNGLEEDIEHPTPNSKLTKILDSTLYDTFVNKDNNDNRPFVTSMNDILWNRSLGYIPNNKSVISWEDFVNMHSNKKIANQAMNAIKNVNYGKKIIFWEFINNMDKNHKCVEDMDIRDLIKIYHEKGIEGFKSYEILVPMYITRDGDIFGTKDVNSMGFKIKNYKIILVQRLNVFDILEPYLYNIEYYKNELKSIKNDTKYQQNEKIYIMTQSTIIIIFVIVGSGLLQNRLSSKNKK